MLKLIYKDYSEFSKFSSLIKNYLFDLGETDEETEYNVRLAICELAGNIIKHSKSIATVNLTADGQLIKINISGSLCFDYNIDGLPPVCSECGRGIFLVKEISEELFYYNGGRDVSVTIKRRIIK